jgi:hypothetical protein
MINADGKSGWDLDPVVNDLIGHGYPNTGLDQWEFQDPKMEVLYHIRPYFVGISLT